MPKFEAMSVKCGKHTALAICFLECQNLRQYTVIRNGNFSAKTLFGDTMLGNTYAAYYWTSKTTRISEKIKKAKEGHKGQSKGQTHTKIKFSNFFDIVGFI